MPTNRTRLRRLALPTLSEAQLCFLLDLELPPVLTNADLWWFTVERGADDPGLAYYERSAKFLWEQHRDRLLPVWRELHGDAPYPTDTDPISWPGTAETSWRDRHDEEMARRRPAAARS